MATVKLTKNELREQQKKLVLFQKYLPTLQLKKARLQLEVNKASLEIVALKGTFSANRSAVAEFSPLMINKSEADILHYAEISYVKKHYENIAGVEIPIFEEVVFHPAEYSLFNTPIWTDAATELVRAMIVAREQLSIGEEKKRALEKELREVSIRVNLFEKILIPRSTDNIKKIRVFLGDQQLAAVSQAKVAKAKIQKAREEEG